VFLVAVVFKRCSERRVDADEQRQSEINDYRLSRSCMIVVMFRLMSRLYWGDFLSQARRARRLREAL